MLAMAVCRLKLMEHLDCRLRLANRKLLFETLVIVVHDLESTKHRQPQSDLGTHFGVELLAGT